MALAQKFSLYLIWIAALEAIETYDIWIGMRATLPYMFIVSYTLTCSGSCLSATVISATRCHHSVNSHFRAHGDIPADQDNSFSKNGEMEEPTS
jgi:hypothetical protein